jgi:F0F1-type ATP synthase assembly protein I
MYEHQHKWGPFTLALVIAGGIVVGGIALTMAFWLLHLVAGIVFALLRVAILVGLAAGIVWLVRTVVRERHPV